MNTARTKIKNSKVLYLSQINLLKHLQGLGVFTSSDPKSKKENKVTQCFEAALFASDLGQKEKKEMT